MINDYLNDLENENCMWDVFACELFYEHKPDSFCGYILSILCVPCLRFVTPDISDVKEESNEDLDEGPPPGWESVLPCQMPQPQTPPLQPPSTVSSSELCLEFFVSILNATLTYL